MSKCPKPPKTHQTRPAKHLRQVSALWDRHKQTSNQEKLLSQTLGRAAHRNQIDRSAIPLSHTHLHPLPPPDHFLAFVRLSCPFSALYPVTLVNCKVLFGSLLSKNSPPRGCPSVTGTIKSFFLHPCSPPPFFIFISKHISKMSCLFASVSRMSSGGSPPRRPTHKPPAVHLHTKLKDTWENCKP